LNPIFRFLIAALPSLVLLGQAVALSCMAWDARAVYQYAAEAEQHDTTRQQKAFSAQLTHRPLRLWLRHLST